jgi:hypothetical protein
LVRRAAILPFIPLTSVEDVWFQALEDRDNADITQLTQPFIDYVTDQSVEGDRPLWNHYGTEGPHTTNSIEGWHCKLKKMTKHAHPNIYTAMQLFKDIQNSIEIAKIQRVVGGTISELQISCVFAMKTSKNACIIRSDTFMHTYCCVSNLSKFGAYLYAVDDNTSCT